MVDGIDEAEWKAAQRLMGIAESFSDLSDILVSRPWVEDGVDDPEYTVIDHLGEIARRDEAAALWIVEQPFLETVEPVDAGAMASLRHLSDYFPDQFQRVVTHPTLHGGITDAWVHVIVVLGVVKDNTPELLDTLLDPAQVTVEERTIDLPLAGEMDLAIVRTRPGSPRTMDMLEQSVRGAEAFMRTPLPVGHVTVILDENIFDDSIPLSGFNALIYIAVRASHDVDDHAIFILSHEIVHYYWSGNRVWVNEGAATFMSRILRGEHPDRWSEPLSFHFRFVANIAELERLLDQGSDLPYLIHSNYILGPRIFADLYRTLGDDAFRDGFRNFYLMSEGVRSGIRELQAAFKDAVPDYAAAVDTIAARWYDSSQPYDLSHLDTGLADPSLPAWNGQLDRAYITLSEDGPPVDQFSAQGITDRVRLTLDYSYRDNLDPLRFEVVEYFEDGFVFRRHDVTVATPPERTSYAYHLPIGMSIEPGSGFDLSEFWGYSLGRYWINVYHEGRKLADVTYEVIP